MELWIRVGIAVCAVLMAFVAGTHFAVGQAPLGAPPGAGPEASATKVLVKDGETGKPMVGARVTARSGARGEVESRATTDAAGVATLEGISGMLYLHVAAPERVRALIRWVPAPGQPLPAQFEFALEKPVTMGGTVVDDTGKPLAGAKVMLAAYKKNAATGQEAEGARFDTVLTDEKGHWQFAGLPMKPDSVVVGAVHPEFLPERGFIELREYKDIGALLAGKAVVPLKRGVTIDGLVRDPDGQPVRGARVGYGEDRVASNVIPEERVKDDGTFRLGVPAGSEAVITVKATGYAPELKRVKVGTEGLKVTFDLQRPQMLTGTVVDTEGKPIADARVVFDRWRGARTLDEDVQTDEAGHFTWDGAPADEIQVDVGKRGYGSKSHLTVKAGDENLLTLPGATRFAGKVVDAASGEPIKKFDVTVGIAFPDGEQHWLHDSRSPVQDGAGPGEFKMVFSTDYPAMKLRVEAAGYLVADCPPFKLDGTAAEFTFKLTKGTGVEGAVLYADGKPVRGTEVLLMDGKYGFNLNFDEFRYAQREYPHTATDAAGRFRFPAQTESYILMVVTAEGATALRGAEFEKTHTLRLQKWGRIEGQAKVGTKPAVGVEVAAGNMIVPPEKTGDRSFVQAGAKVKVDDAGKFVMDQVLPGKVSLSIVGGAGATSAGSGDRTEVEVKPGETAHVQLGGHGRPVTGKAGVSSDERLKGAKAKWVSLVQVMETKRAPFALPVEVMEMPRDEVRAWSKKFAESDEGKAIAATQKAAQENRHTYNTSVTADGSFRMDDVVPGRYRLNIIWLPAGLDLRTATTANIAFNGRASVDVVVPEIAPGGGDGGGGVSDVPLDVGTVVPEYVAELKVGEVVPAVKLESLDGKPLTLADYRGKYLLLVEWEPSGREDLIPPAAGELWEKYKNDSRFALLGVTHETVAASAKKYTQAKSISWPMALTAEGSYFGMWFPMVDSSVAWLIGPDRKIVAAKLKGDEIKAVVEKALGK